LLLILSMNSANEFSRDLLPCMHYQKQQERSKYYRQFTDLYIYFIYFFMIIKIIIKYMNKYR
ncbi:hypothetical protein ACMBCN_02590, partial [Candidatus Liberibacter asiaticus]|nr:hypothetical protein [Candidatus Liberibacter asiaticus]